MSTIAIAYGRHGLLNKRQRLLPLMGGIHVERVQPDRCLRGIAEHLALQIGKDVRLLAAGRAEDLPHIGVDRRCVINDEDASVAFNRLG